MEKDREAKVKAGEAVEDEGEIGDIPLKHPKEYY